MKPPGLHAQEWACVGWRCCAGRLTAADSGAGKGKNLKGTEGCSVLRCSTAQVFDDKSVFNSWFGEAMAGSEDGGGGDEWLETEKRVVVIHRLHQILEPFMLRRQVEDVESKLPPKARSRGRALCLLCRLCRRSD
jgi:SNF2-related domain